MRVVLVILLCFSCPLVFAQSVEVPEKIVFAGITLTLTQQARARVQEKVNSLMQSRSYFNPIVERADLFLPIVEEILKKENIPEDFKFSPIHESLLIGTAISSSDALGYWQFKKNTAIECLLRVDSEIDQRMNIVDATRGACTYLNKSYPRLKNWLFTLLAYNLGPTGAENHLRNHKIAIENSSRITIEGELAKQPYILYYLAYKTAFEGAIYKQKRNFKLLVYEDGAGKTLQDISNKTGISINDLKAYNPWLLTEVIPTDNRKYYVIIPIPVEREKEIANLLKISPKSSSEDTIPLPQIDEETEESQPIVIDSPYPVITSQRTQIVEGIPFMFAQINGLKGFMVDRNYDVSVIASALKISSNKLRKINDLEMSQSIQEGMVYYLEKKKIKADIPQYHIVKESSLWEVSQNLGIQLKYLAKYNELDENENIPQGLVVWVQEKRPKHIDPEIRPLAKKEEKPKETPQKEEVIKQSDIEIVVQKPEENIVVEEGFYLVKEDDESIFEIARKHNVNVLDLKAWNNLPIDLSLKKGQILRVAPPVINEDAYKPTHQNINDPENPINLEKELGMEVVKNADVKVVKDKNTTTNTNTTPSKEPAYEQITHIVKSGETLTSIAMQYNVKPEDIITWNDLTSRSLDPDQYLIIKIPKNKSTPFVTPTQPTQEIDYHKPAITVEEKTTPTSASSVKKEVVVQNIRNEKGIRIHKVQRGEFPNRIAAAYGLRWQQIKEWTGLTDDNIREGMELIVENPQPFTKNRFDKPAIENKPTPTEQTKDKTPQPIYHTVKQGETMFRLTQMYKVSQEQIRKWNNLADNNIKIGMQYIVGYRNEEIPLAKEKESISEPTKPKKEENSTAAKPQYHKVQVGETLFSLAKKYGVSIEQIKKLNNIQNNVLVPGKEVRIR